jgi:ABC-type bacteriocin/lantibiotic exporter with double-glycine peptidase domain
MPKSSIPVPHLPQELDYSCVPACIRMVLAFYGLKVPESQLRALFKIRPSGTSLANVLLRLPELGMSASVYSASLFELERYLEDGTPCIVQVWTEHLSYWRAAWMHDLVVVGIEGDTVLVNDPAFPDAPKAIAKSEFEHAWAAADRLLIRIEKSKPSA